jgi:hypothetical protein
MFGVMRVCPEASDLGFQMPIYWEGYQLLRCILEAEWLLKNYL